jgi:phage FluMu gp28-like protein
MVGKNGGKKWWQEKMVGRNKWVHHSAQVTLQDVVTNGAVSPVVNFTTSGTFQNGGKKWREKMAGKNGGKKWREKMVAGKKWGRNK